MSSPYLGGNKSNFLVIYYATFRFNKVVTWERDGQKYLKNVEHHLWTAPYFTKNVKAIRTLLPTFKFCSMGRKVSK